MTIKHDDFDLMVAGIAKEQARKYPVPAPDLRQEIWLVFYGDEFQRYLAEIPEGDDRMRYVRAMAYRTCKRAGMAEKAHREGYDVGDIAYYSEALVEKLLDAFFQWRTDGSLPQGEAGLGRSTTPLNEQGVALVMMCDVSRAWDDLPAHSRELLYKVHASAYAADWQRLGEQWDCSKEAAKQRYRRCVTKICRTLNDFKSLQGLEWIGTRPVLSNAAMQAVTGPEL